ncbi:MAG TPA: thioredoxin [Rhizobiales bacterium]|nr:thioredoxin [Hyphomicrobiales bacterium]
MLSRRSLIALGAGAAISSRFSRLQAAEIPAPVLGDDGLYHQPWFLDSFLELKDDLEETTQKNKRFAVFWELKGCPYCKETHFVNFARPDINKFVRENFEIVQLNLLGSRTVTDFDGEEMSEKALAKKYGVRFSPTIQFFPADGAKLAGLSPRKRVVASIRGYIKPDDFLAMFKFVKSESYKTMPFRKYLKAARSS